MKQKNLLYIKQQVEDALVTKEDLEIAIREYDKFLLIGKHCRYRMSLHCYNKESAVYKGEVGCKDVPAELALLLEIIMRKRRDVLQKQFDETQIILKAKEE